MLDLSRYPLYYIVNAIRESKGKGIVLVGYGSYTGYVDRVTGSSGDLLINASGHVVEEGPLVDVLLEKKNENFDHILKIIEKNKF